MMAALSLSRNAENITISNVADLLKTDPFVVAQLLKTVNSTFYGLPRTVVSIEKAIVMLGPAHVLSLIIATSMRELKSVLSGPAEASFNRLILHSVATAHLSRFLIEELPRQFGISAEPEMKGVGFTAGLLHDFGKIILVYNHAEAALKLYEEYGQTQNLDAALVQARERALFGLDHTDAGRQAASKLRFPSVLVEAILMHHCPQDVEGDRSVKQVVAATTLADLVARVLGYSFTSPLTREASLDDPAWHQYLNYAPCAVSSVDELVEMVFAEGENLALAVKAF